MSAYTDFKSLIEQAPEASGFIVWPSWNADGAQSDQPYIVAAKSGGPTDEDVERCTFDVWFISRVNPVSSDIDSLTSNAEAISQYLAKNFTSNCVIGASVISSVSTPTRQDDNRFVCRLVADVLYSIY